ncbi:predicted protein [Sclerotinia sclerotiorum 1980 UF-70]|uniref:Uncharacterized protein n=1 Tax=Sclerotinia sclerotiorum (strain ATCC 18683 / 1980 / Ss-1) TaxID=665079 RepID=A7ES25_SCLS1|nr:predicted protein [Sclerotinia sclerotiorum 1980 UF-70]EDN92267.1 predicted protein [Sclerotinia sclerotiorum 1980 UF-70]
MEIRLKLWHNSVTARVIYIRGGIQYSAGEDHFADEPCRKRKIQSPIHYVCQSPKP